MTKFSLEYTLIYICLKNMQKVTFFPVQNINFFSEGKLMLHIRCWFQNTFICLFFLSALNLLLLLVSGVWKCEVNYYMWHVHTCIYPETFLLLADIYKQVQCV